MSDFFLAYVDHPWATLECPQNVNPFGPAVWPARGNIYTNVLFNYIYVYIHTWRPKNCRGIGQWVLLGTI